jgi:hypothetical protein
MVYVTAHAGAVGALLAYDAHGGTSCFAEQCYPLWEAGFAGGSAPAVANGVVYVGGPALYAFDAAGVKGCTGRVIGPRPAAGTCVPLWSAATAPYYQGSAPAVANGVVYIGAGGSCCVGFLVAFDAAGTMHCSGTPKTCTPVWTSDTGFDPIESSPAVANGFVYVGDSFNTGVAAFHFG